MKLLKGRNGPTRFLPLSSKIGGQVNNDKPSIGQYLTRVQANFVYKKTKLGEMINTDTLHQEIEHERQLKRIDDTNGDTNPYKELIVNNAEKIEPLLAQMEQWSILSNTLNYIQYDKHPKNFRCSFTSKIFFLFLYRTAKSHNVFGALIKFGLISNVSSHIGKICSCVVQFNEICFPKLSSISPK